MAYNNRQAPGSPGSQKSNKNQFGLNPSRAKSTRWTNAPTYSYGGDDWGDDDVYDDDQLDHVPAFNSDIKRNSGQFGYGDGPYDAPPAMPSIPAQYQHPNRSSTLPLGYDTVNDQPRPGIARQGTTPVGHTSRFAAPSIQRKPSKMEREARMKSAVADQMAPIPRPQLPQANESVYFTPAQDQAEYGWSGAGQNNDSQPASFDNHLHKSNAGVISPDSPSVISEFIGQSSMTPTTAQTSATQSSPPRIIRPRDIYAQAHRQSMDAPRPQDQQPAAAVAQPTPTPTVVEPESQASDTIPEDENMHDPGRFQDPRIPVSAYDKSGSVSPDNPTERRGLVTDVSTPEPSSHNSSELDLGKANSGAMANYIDDTETKRKSSLFLDVDTEDDINRKNKISPPPAMADDPTPPMLKGLALPKQGFLQVPSEVPPQHQYQYDSEDEGEGLFRTGSPPNGSRSPSPTSSMGSYRRPSLTLATSSPTSPLRSPTAAERDMQQMQSLNGSSHETVRPVPPRAEAAISTSAVEKQQQMTENSPSSVYTKSQPPSSRASPIKEGQEQTSFAEMVAGASGTVTTTLSSLVTNAFLRSGETPNQTPTSSALDPSTKEDNRKSTAISPILPWEFARTSNTAPLIERGIPPSLDRADSVSPPTPTERGPISGQEESLNWHQEPSNLRHNTINNLRNGDQWQTANPHNRSGSPVVVVVPQPGQTEIAKSAEWAVATPIMIGSSPRQSPTSTRQSPINALDEESMSQPLMSTNSQPILHTPQPSNSHLVPSTVPDMQEKAESLSGSPLSSVSTGSRSIQPADVSTSPSASSMRSPSFANFLNSKSPAISEKLAATASPTGSMRAPSFAGFLGTKNLPPPEKAASPSTNPPSFINARTSPAPQAAPQAALQPVAPPAVQQPAQPPSFRNFLGQKASTSQSNIAIVEDPSHAGFNASPVNNFRNSILPPRALMQQNNDSESNVSSVGSELKPAFGIVNTTQASAAKSDDDSEALRREILRDLDFDSQASPETPKDYSRQAAAVESATVDGAHPIPKRIGVAPLSVSPPIRGQAFSSSAPAIPEQSPMRRSMDGKKNSFDAGREGAILPPSTIPSMSQKANAINDISQVTLPQQPMQPGSNFPPPPSSEVSAVSRPGRDDDEVSLATPTVEKNRFVEDERATSPDSRYIPSPVDNGAPIKLLNTQQKSYGSMPVLMDLKDILALSDADDRIVAADKARKLVAADLITIGGQTLQVWMQHVQSFDDPYRNVLSSNVSHSRKLPESDKWEQWNLLDDELDGSRPSTADSEELALTGRTRQTRQPQLVTPQPTRLPNDPRVTNILQTSEGRSFQGQSSSQQQAGGPDFSINQQSQSATAQEQVKPAEAQDSAEHRQPLAKIKDSLGGVGKGFKGLFGGRKKDKEEVKDEDRQISQVQQPQPGPHSGFASQQQPPAQSEPSKGQVFSSQGQPPQGIPNPQYGRRTSFQNLQSGQQVLPLQQIPSQELTQPQGSTQVPRSRPVSATGRRPSADGSRSEFIPPILPGTQGRRPPGVTLNGGQIVPLSSPGEALAQNRAVSLQNPAGNPILTGSFGDRRAISTGDPVRSSSVITGPPGQNDKSAQFQPQGAASSFVTSKPSSITTQGPQPVRPFDPDGPPPLRRVSNSQPLPPKRTGMRAQGETFNTQRPSEPPVAFSASNVQQGRSSSDSTMRQQRPDSASYGQPSQISPAQQGQIHLINRIQQGDNQVQQGQPGQPGPQSQNSFGSQSQHLQAHPPSSAGGDELSVSESSVNSESKKKRFSTNLLSGFGNTFGGTSSTNNASPRNSSSTMQSGEKPKGSFLSNQLKKLDAIGIKKESPNAQGFQGQFHGTDPNLNEYPGRPPQNQLQRAETGQSQYSGPLQNQPQQIETGQAQFQAPGRVNTGASDALDTPTGEKKKSVFGRFKELGTLDPLGKTEKLRNQKQGPVINQGEQPYYQQGPNQPQMGPQNFQQNQYQARFTAAPGQPSGQEVYDVATGTLITREEMNARNEEAAAGHFPGLGQSPLLPGHDDPTTPKAVNQVPQSYFAPIPGSNAPPPLMNTATGPNAQQHPQTNTQTYSGQPPIGPQSGSPQLPPGIIRDNTESISEAIRQSLDQGRSGDAAGQATGLRKAVNQRQMSIDSDIPPPPISKAVPMPQMSVQPAGGLIRKISSPPPPAARFLVTPRNPPPRRPKMGLATYDGSQEPMNGSATQNFTQNYGQGTSSVVSAASSSPGPHERAYQTPMNQPVHRSSSPPPMMMMAGGGMTTPPPREQQTNSYGRSSPIAARQLHTQSPIMLISPPTEPSTGGHSTNLTPEPTSPQPSQPIATQYEPVMPQNRPIEPVSNNTMLHPAADLLTSASQASDRTNEEFVSAAASRSVSPVITRTDTDDVVTAHHVVVTREDPNLRTSFIPAVVSDDNNVPIANDVSPDAQPKMEERAVANEPEEDEDEFFDDKIAVEPEGPVPEPAKKEEEEDMPVMSATSGPGLGWENEYFYTD